MNAIVTAFAEQGLTLGAILLLAIFMQAKLHGLGDSLRKEMSDMRDDLRKDIGKQGERIARIEGLLAPEASYEVVAEPPSGGRLEPE